MLNFIFMILQGDIDGIHAEPNDRKVRLRV